MKNKKIFSPKNRGAAPRPPAGARPKKFNRSTPVLSTTQQKAAVQSKQAQLDSSSTLFKNSSRVVCGTHALSELFLVHAPGVVELWLRQGWESSEDLRQLNELALRFKIKSEVKTVAALDRINAGHQGAVAFVAKDPLWTPQWKTQIEKGLLEKSDPSVLLFLDGLEDPHNLGAILRTSWLMGVQGIFIPQDRAVGLTPTVHKVACGGVEHVPVVQTTSFARDIEELKQKGYWVFGLSHKSEKTLFDMKLPEKVIWMIGAEDKGLRVSSEKLCDELVQIPQQSASASYNASVAAAIALCETSRQHLRKSL
ncbi:MAG: 23S rRNA (guanosine(2251)-2'-O)-methyltransferase RlmB [Pseudobdellovibrionaceae bacterium]